MISKRYILPLCYPARFPTEVKDVERVFVLIREVGISRTWEAVASVNVVDLPGIRVVERIR